MAATNLTPLQQEEVREIAREEIEEAFSINRLLPDDVEAMLDRRAGAIGASNQQLLIQARELANEEIHKHVRLIGRSAMDESAADTFDKNIHDAIVMVLEQAVGIQPWTGSAGAKERMDKILVALRKG